MKKRINTELKEILDESPKTTGEKAKINVLETYHECLAQAYTTEGWRHYMENLINVLVRDAVISFDDIEQLRYKQGKIAGLKELLTRSERAFKLSHKINQVNSLQNEKSNENA